MQTQDADNGVDCDFELKEMDWQNRTVTIADGSVWPIAAVHFHGGFKFDESTPATEWNKISPSRMPHEMISMICGEGERWVVVQMGKYRMVKNRGHLSVVSANEPQ